MPHLIRDAAEEVLKDILLSRIVRFETQNASESSDLKQEKDAFLLLNEVLRRKAGGLFRISVELIFCGKGWAWKWRGPFCRTNT